MEPITLRINTTKFEIEVMKSRYYMTQLYTFKTMYFIFLTNIEINSKTLFLIQIHTSKKSFYFGYLIKNFQ